MRLHERLGFEPVGALRRVGRKLDACRDTGWWQLPLRAAAAVDPPRPLQAMANTPELSTALATGLRRLRATGGAQFKTHLSARPAGQRAHFQ